MTSKTSIGDISILEAIKDLLELKIDDCLKVNVNIRIGNLTVDTNTFIPRKNWEKLLPSIVEGVKGAERESGHCEEDFNDSPKSIDAEGLTHGITPKQAFIAFLLQKSGMSLGWILLNCDALKYLYNSLKIELVRDYSDSDELSMLKEIKNLQLALYGIDEDGEHHEHERIVFIEDEYPTVLLDMIYAKYKEAK